MYTVLIADDEAIIRRGLKKILDWETLGFKIIGEASNGVETLSYINKNNPDIVLIDIKMPGMDGLEVLSRARSNKYKGKVIILSGYSDFKYAQEAIRYDVKYYLTKPIDVNELKTALSSLLEQIKEESSHRLTVNHYKEKAENTILLDLLQGTADLTSINFDDLHMTSTIYQVLIYEKYSRNIADITYHFSELLKVTNQDNSSFHSVNAGNNEVIILKGEFAIQKFNEFLNRFERELKPQKGSPLDSLFIAYGRTVTSPKDIHISYKDSSALLQRRFFCEVDQHTIGYKQLPVNNSNAYYMTHDLLLDYCSRLVAYIQSFNRKAVADTLHNLEIKLYNSEDSIHNIKLFLTDLFIEIKDKLNNLYSTKKLTIPTNTQIIDFIQTKNYLYEIFLFFTEQFEVVMNLIGNFSRDSVIDDILYYIQHNYMDNIRLENIASLFGYNSSYLGKIFSLKLGESFNSYIDKVRIENSKELLKQKSLKIYEIAEKVGYQNTDYFYMKFKKNTGITPAEYRRKNVTPNDSCKDL
ncbi:response regulator transcription factor [Anaerocolumna sp. AGMB13025]|uniref:response regulator transcription factor n=1 Tax=Anaerocolumna sp. AGMB13025 TaxID=3039116 RepID=UPI00241D8747|nr:response regulator transcription factor [Anaerocolumna sp. AGMB13025]WFR58871.1 response regulator transcription factor [Anaerocolumna sp. AGMB13025]